ncbi:PAS domain-containing sensor histidine kinase [Bacillus sp. V3-13]|uniref:PAS domain-containing sensor histidine kinase n=1 Tax=Bacillus sp. V3-13 TaxID=2053728 RepID=UPI000C7612CD|nr:PAS domain-containing sensor histidine kinase [Bacillus sp. V3-13]PLR76659.1 PAS domain-containing sensor histidine kinase [Bacillus sp. V3-13]
MIDTDLIKVGDEQDEIQNLRLALTHSKDVLTKHSENGTFLFVTPSSYSLLGYSPRELFKKNLYDFCHPNDHHHLDKIFQHLAVRKTVRVSFRFRRKEGDYIWLETISSPTNQGNETICISRDMTERIIMEEEILETQEKYRLLVEFSRDTIGMTTGDGIWTYINGEGRKLLGFTSNNEIIGTSLYDYVAESDQKYLTNFLAANQSINFELNLKRSDGQVRRAEIQLIPTIYKNRRMFQIIIRDITGQKRTEERLHNAEKLSVVGQLAASIAHEIRNPLTAIKGFTQLLGEREADDYTPVILEELKRIESIVTDLLVLAKPQATNMERANIVNLVKGVVTLLNTQAIMCNITINVVTSDHELYVDCEVSKMKQVLINIIQNGIEAMPAGGEILITIKQDQNYIYISVKDQGIGIPEERMSKLGEPFYSTKEKGTGLGLMICNKILKTHKGNLHIESKENEGTTVNIILPRA